MKQHFRSHALWLAILALTLLAAPAFAQVPQDMTYTGRLVDNLGDPLAGPVNLELRIFDAETAGTQLYSEQHVGVPLDATGGFSVQLGLGTSPVGTFDAALFSNVDRYLEVVAGIEVLTPRQIIGSVPWALIAQQANEIAPAACSSGFMRVGTWCLTETPSFLRSATSVENNSGSTPTDLDTELGLVDGSVKAAIVRISLSELVSAPSSVAAACLSSSAFANCATIQSLVVAQIHTGEAGSEAHTAFTEVTRLADAQGQIHTQCVWRKTTSGGAVCRWELVGYSDL